MSQVRAFAGKIAIVTGASRGIGAAICSNLASKGCNLICNYTSPNSTDRTQTLADTLATSHNIQAFPVRIDMGSPEAGSTLIEATKHHFGNTAIIHFIINNAGISVNEKVHEFTLDNFHRHYAVNVLGPLLVMQAAAPHLPKDRSARIVNVSSVSSALGYPGQSIYGGSKAAVEAMTRTWAREFAECGTVNAVNPGPVETDMYGGVTKEFERINKSWLENTPGSQVSVERDGEAAVARYGPLGGRPATVDEIAGVVGMLCSAESGWCTGSVVCANGGMRMSP